MQITPGHFLAPLVMLLFLLSAYFLLDFIFIQAYDSDSKAFDNDFLKIEQALNRNAYDEVLYRSDENTKQSWRWRE